MSTAAVAVEAVASRILLVRGLRVLLDSDLAALYGVPTKRFNQAVKRNSAKFPAEFMFQLTDEEFASLRSLICDLKRRARGTPLFASRLHGARSPDGGHDPRQPAGHRGVRLCRARLRAACTATDQRCVSA